MQFRHPLTGSDAIGPLRFALRDLFWLTLLVAVVCVNWITYRAAMDYKAERDAALKA